jgi:NADH:ubiquinone oxidoreductase subunit 6 (subunit J)
MVLFFAFSGIAIVSGCLLITQRNPVRAALSFALVVLSTCGLFLLLAAPFLMAATIIVYTGAIVVTFLFVIMLAQQEGPSDADHRSREPEFSCITGFVLLGSILFLLQLTYDTRATDRLLSRVHQAIDFIDGLLDQKPIEQNRQPSLQKIKEDLDNRQLHAMFEEFNEEVKRQREFPEFTAIDGKIMNAESSWAALVGELDRSIKATTSGRSPNDVEEVRKQLEEMRNSLRDLEETGIQFRNSYGRLQLSPEKEKGLSPFSKPESYPYRADSTDFGPGLAPLPRENVASLGRSLFTDYLLPVELAGTLLLVATIGAIAIAGRRAEGLR